MKFLNKFEKILIKFQDLLDNDQKRLIKEISNEIRLKEEIKKVQHEINYDLNKIFVNFDLDAL